MSIASEQYTTTPVATSSLLNGIRIALILSGLMVALPAFVFGADLNAALGARQAILASLMGATVLAVISALCGIAGARSRLSTYMLIVDAFGKHGAILANGVLALSLLGAFGVVAMMFGRAMASLHSTALRTADDQWMAIAGCIATIATTLIGIRAIDTLSLITTPLKMGIVLTIFGLAAAKGLDGAWTYIPAQSIPLGTGVSTVTGALIVGATLAPDICRFARSPWHAALACSIAYGVSFPLILTLCGLPSLAMGMRDPVAIMLALGLGLPAMLIIILAAWATNTFNLYATSLALSAMQSRLGFKSLVLLSGAVGAALGLAGVDEKLMGYFYWLSVSIPPIAGIYLFNFYANTYWPAHSTPANWRLDALLAWSGAVAIAVIMEWSEIHLTAVAALDAILVALLIYGPLRTFMPKSLASKV